MKPQKPLSKEQFTLEILACLEEQVYQGELNRAGLILIGLWELQGDFINGLVRTEQLSA